MKIIGVIPARLKSTRLPGKMLLPLDGKPLVWWVYRAAKKAKGLDGLVVAADDRRILAELKKRDVPCVLTSRKHKSGTDRIGEIASTMKADAYINIQGDEPLMNPKNIDILASELRGNRKADVVTLRIRIRDKKTIDDPNCVKVITDAEDRAITFSRCPIPYDRDGSGKTAYYKHLGLYGYRRDVLRKIVRLPVSKLEKAEKLEQLRFLENGLAVYAPETKYDSIGVDTREDYLGVKKIVESRKRSLRHTVIAE